MRNFETSFGYPPGENVLVRTHGSASGGNDATLREAGIGGDLLDLYTQVERISLPDAGNGYFIHSPVDVVGGVREYQPTRVVGAMDDEIVVFGSDGGGGLFAASTRGNGVYRLEGGSLFGQTYEVQDSEATKVSNDLWGFLEYFELKVAGDIPSTWS